MLRHALAVSPLLLLSPAAPTDSSDPFPPGISPVERASRLVRAYHAGDVEALQSHLAESFTFRDPVLGQHFDRQGFLDMVAEMGAGETERRLDIAWIGAASDHGDVRGTWSWTDAESSREREFLFSIELQFATADGKGQVVSWLDDFRRRSMWKPASGDSRLETEHFRLVWYRAELSSKEAARLAQTLEDWYEKTSQYLGRSFDDGFRLDINVAGGHASPYASNPGPEAFILVPARSARREYGFSLVHELTHNLMGLSWLSQHERERNGIELFSGNRLFDEGFAVYVEEELTGEGPEVWPNFGEETHAAYWRLRKEKNEPVWPPLEAEIHREHGDTRLGYLAQASFTKYLVETYGVGSFLTLYDAEIARAEAVYGRPLDHLERDWRRFLENRFRE